MVDWKKPIAVRRRNPYDKTQPGKTYPARVICTDRRGRFPYVVLVTSGSKETLQCFGEDGVSAHGGRVINVPKTRTIWRAVLYERSTDDVNTVYSTNRAELERDVQDLKRLGHLVIEDIHEYTFEVPTCAD